MTKDVDFDSLVLGGSLESEELYWKEGYFTDGTPIGDDELDRLAQEHYGMLYDAASRQQVGDFA